MPERTRTGVICRNCGKQYDPMKSRADYRGYCTAKCLHEKAKEHGYRKSGELSEYYVLKRAGEIGDKHS